MNTLCRTTVQIETTTFDRYSNLPFIEITANIKIKRILINMVNCNSFAILFLIIQLQLYCNSIFLIWEKRFKYILDLSNAFLPFSQIFLIHKEWLDKNEDGFLMVDCNFIWILEKHSLLEKAGPITRTY